MSTQTPPSPPPKPIAEVWRPQLVGLPELTPARRWFRSLMRGLLRLIAWLCLKPTVSGLENLPAGGPALLVINHLGDADAALLLTYAGREVDAIAKIEMYDFPVIGRLMHWYGVIWVHRGRPDMKALRAALRGLAEGRCLVIAPEGRYSLIQGLEEGTDGAAFLARKAGVTVVPVAITGTENSRTYCHLRHFRRAPVSLSVGPAYRLTGAEDGGLKGSKAVHADTQRIMESLARLLPPEYRGVYSDSKEL